MGKSHNILINTHNQLKVFSGHFVGRYINQHKEENYLPGHVNCNFVIGFKILIKFGPEILVLNV